MKKTLLILLAALAAMALVISCNNNVEVPPEAKTYTVTFDSNGGSDVSPKTQSVKEGEKVQKPSDPTRDEYDFKGWKNNGADFSFDTPISSDITLKAEWEKNTFTVTFDSRGGSEVSPKTVKVKKGGKVTKPAADPLRDGFDFGGWTLNDAAFDFDNYTVSDDITLVAKWTKDGKVVYTVSYNYNDGETDVKIETVEKDSKITSEPDNPTRDGYDFAGWTKDNSFFDFDTSITDDITLKAAWKKIYKAGDKGPTGGYIVYDIDADNSSSEPKGSDGLASSDLGWRYIEAAPKDLENDSKNTYIFGYYKEDKIGWTYAGTEAGIGKGKINTATLVDRMGDTAYTTNKDDAETTSEYAAKACHDYSIEVNGITYSDWFLPSKEETSKMYLQKDIASFTTTWMSWEDSSAEKAWMYVLSAGSSSSTTRDAAFGVRPVRYFSVCALSESGEHSWNDGAETKASTCKENGEMLYTCTLCGETMTEEIPTLKHTWNDGAETTAPTCGKSGTKTYTCTVSGCEATRDVSIPATGNHTWGAVTDIDTSTCKGKSTCSVCNAAKIVVAHTYKNYKCQYCNVWQQGPSGGYVFYDCDADNGTDANGNVTAGDDGLMSSVCGWRYLEASPVQLPASYAFGYYRPDGTTNTAVVTEAGIGKGANNTYELIKAMGKETYISSTDNTKGNYAAYAVDDWTYTNPTTGKEYSDWFLPSSGEVEIMSKNLSTMRSEDGDVDPLKIASATWMTSTEVDKDNCNITNGNSGKTLPILPRDSNSSPIRPVRAFGGCTSASGEHDWDETDTKKPTCDTAGYTQYTCKNCSKTKFEVWVATGEHTWDDGTITTEPTCKEGVKTYTCSACGKKKSLSIPATREHNMVVSR